MERQPVVNRAFIVAAVALVVAALGKAGVVVPEDVAGNLIEVAAVLAPLAVAYWARRHVTPVKDPRNADGAPLVPAGETVGTVNVEKIREQIARIKTRDRRVTLSLPEGDQDVTPFERRADG